MKKPLYKHTIIIWAEEDLTQDTDGSPPSGWTEDPVVVVARESYDGQAICSHFRAEKVEDPEQDPSFDEGTASFFADALEE